MKNNPLNKLQKWMMGRNGGDQLSLALLILSLLLSIVSGILDLPIIAYISYIPFVFAVYRIFSKNVDKRRLENYKFMIKLSPIYSFYHKRKTALKDRKTHKYFKCPNCKQGLRVPKGKGKINITCSKCGTKFVKQS
ncbi:hypothetical protein [Alkalibaculum bacchi]|uniref:hypothetical protein n=1 Tax=Alkalibaculum bacchi TaxID=645887 RepID=UPI0026EFF3CE|nr:hypothetical protein [Alkalibaculum bacchi]